MPLPKQKVIFAADKTCIKSVFNPSGQWTIAELKQFTINCGVVVLFSDLGFYIDDGEVKKA